MHESYQKARVKIKYSSYIYICSNPGKNGAAYLQLVSLFLCKKDSCQLGFVFLNMCVGVDSLFIQRHKN